MKLTISIVTFNNEDVIEKALTSIQQSSLAPDRCRVVVVDNDSHDNTPHLIASGFPGLTLIRSENIGFGAGHNKAIAEALEKFPTAPYHLVMNPDIYFDGTVLERLTDFMDQRPDVGLLMPKILYPGKDQRVQHLCKRLPTPLDSIGRRFIPGFLKNLPALKKRFDRYECRDRDYNKIMEVPHLSGCFMMLRRKVFETVGYFDERFFMYLEDVDFSRRIHSHFKTIYYPGVSIYHQYRKGSYKQFRHLKYHIVSAIKYFNKWGWFFDSERRKINKNCNRSRV